MRRMGFIFIGAIISLSCLNHPWWASAQQPPIQDSTITLYSVHKHRGEQRSVCINFQRGSSRIPRADCDLAYGLLYAGDELDWFQSATSQGARSVIKDLGEYSWTAAFEVPVVEPLPKLKPGEQRQVTVNVSGADGAPGKSASGVSMTIGGSERTSSSLLPINDGPVPGDNSIVMTAPGPTKPWRPKNDGTPKVDPLFVKAIAGHLYVIHVVDDLRDFYALFHVEALQSGDNCTVSWKLIPEPVKPTGNPTTR